MLVKCPVVVAIIAMVLIFLHQQTPLHIAAGTGHVKTVECLAKLGANITIKDNDGVSA